MLTERQGLVVYLHSLKHAKSLRRFGNVHYVSRKMKYVVLYCNQEDLQSIMNKISGYSYVKRVDPSHKPFIKSVFENSRPDKAKEYDYKMGF
ncbi:YlbG family protein [Rossellomorea marisflavi]|uniref:YlbG family protein n=1 Tax=Rossellomorea marisflavi TaxID=189381 RepID=UPI003D287349